MFSFSRTILVAGSLIAMGAIAEARAAEAGGFPSQGPMPVARPMFVGTEAADVRSALEAAVHAEPAKPGLKDHRASPAHAVVRNGALRGTETASTTPKETTVVAQGPREAAAPTLSDLVARHAHENGVPVGLAEAVVRIESRGNPRASNGGALGLMQIKPGTARAAGFNGGASGLLVADTNLHFGMKILGDAYRSSGGDVCRALMLYQSGHFATRMTSSNRAYCSRARAVMAGA